MNTATPLPHAHFLMPVDDNTTELELTVMNWFAAGHEVLWIPILAVDGSPEDLAEAKTEAENLERQGPFIVRQFTDLYWLPMGIPGWLFPAHLDDTDVVCRRDAQGEISFGHIHRSTTGQRLTWRDPAESQL